MAKGSRILFLFIGLGLLPAPPPASAALIRPIAFPFCQAAVLEPGVPQLQRLEVMRFKGPLRDKLQINRAVVLSMAPNSETRRVHLALRPFDPIQLENGQKIRLRPHEIQDFDLSFDELRHGFDAIGHVGLFMIMDEMPTSLDSVNNDSFYQNLAALDRGTLLLIRGTYFVLTQTPVLLNRHDPNRMHWTMLEEYRERPRVGSHPISPWRTLQFSPDGSALLEGRPLIGSIHIVGNLELGSGGVVTDASGLPPAINPGQNEFRAELRDYRAN